MTCPSDSTLSAFVADELDVTDRDALLGHVDRCASCREAVVAAIVASSATLDRTPDPTSTSVALPDEGGTIGRYRVVGRLGVGGMGVVLRAFDPQLCRELALKVCPLGSGDDGATGGRPRREAQAMARIVHPNVLAVFDVGTSPAGHYVAAEIVEGRTLRRWLADRPPRDAILAVFRAAAEGLAAIHRAGLVHRDFKPENVLIADDGAVKVADLGLARLVGDDDQSLVTEMGSDSDVTDTRFTETGVVLGTPAYMAPEQFLGRAVDGRADQFAFCVALFEALVGRRPFVGGSIRDLREAMATGRVRRIPAGTMPEGVASALARGLQPRPEDRFGSMRALLETMAVPERRPRRQLAAMVGVAMVATLSAFAWPEPAGRAPTDRARALEAEAFDAEARDRAEAGRSAAADHIAASELDAASDALESAYFDAMEAGDRTAAAGTALSLAEHIAGRLGRPAIADAWLAHATSLVGSTPRWQARLAAAKASVALARDDLDTARVEAMRADSLLADAPPDPLLAVVAQRLGWVQVRRGDPELGVQAMRRAAMIMEASVGANHPDTADYRANLGSAVIDVGDLDTAQRECEAALSIFAGTLGRNNVRNGTAHNCLGLVHQARGGWDDAIAHYARSHEFEVQRFGPHHLNVAIIVNNMALVEAGRAHFDEARRRHDEAIAILSAQEPPRPVALAEALRLRSTTLLHAGAATEALRDASRALELATGSLPPEAHAWYAEARCAAALSAGGDAREPCASLLAGVDLATLDLDSQLMVVALAQLELGMPEYEATMACLLDTAPADRPRLLELWPAVELVESLRAHGELDLARALAKRAAAYVPDEPRGSAADRHVRQLRQRLVRGA